MGIGEKLNAQTNEKEKGIETVFTNLELQGIDSQQKLLYGYFFYHTSKEPLEKLKNQLLKNDYRVARFEEIEANQFILHLEKVESHTRQSLLARENELAKLAQQFKIDTYDGWDVGNIDSSKPLISLDQFKEFLQKKAKSELYPYGIKLYEQALYDRACFVFDACIDAKINPDTSYLKLGNCLINLGLFEKGMQQFENAIAINPRYYSAYFNLAAAAYENEEMEKSAQYYSLATQLNAKDDRAFYGLAAAQFVLEKLADCEKNCLKALEINPQNKMAQDLLKMLNK
jgi:tetratricopeptide (TPR) repeat protein